MPPTLPRGSSSGARPPAVLVGVQIRTVSDEAFAASLEELERLAETLGLEVIGRVTQKRPGLGAPNVLGEGKLKELARFTGGSGVVPAFRRAGSGKTRSDATDATDATDAVTEAPHEDEREVSAATAATPTTVGAAADADEPEALQAVTVLVDQDLSPSQMRNLERATGVEVLDRTMVILSIFHRHARTREAKIQVEIARLAYMAPRLRETGADTERQRGGVGGKGAGESTLELGRRATRDRIAELRRALVVVQREAQTQRSRRTGSSTQTVALVGYTNAGKSRLMRALTKSEMYVADRLFATLDTTVRTLMPPTRPPILISDTVGFIKDLPHDLVASFRSTLEEAKEADLVLHVVDASDPSFREQAEVTRRVLAEIQADDRPRLTILNKADLVSAEEQAALAREHPEAVLMSALSAQDVSRLHDRIRSFFEESMEEADFVLRYDQQRKIALLHERGRVLDERYEEDGVHLRVRAPGAVLGGLRREL